MTYHDRKIAMLVRRRCREIRLSDSWYSVVIWDIIHCAYIFPFICFFFTLDLFNFFPVIIIPRFGRIFNFQNINFMITWSRSSWFVVVIIVLNFKNELKLKDTVEHFVRYTASNIWSFVVSPLQKSRNTIQHRSQPSCIPCSFQCRRRYPSFQDDSNQWCWSRALEYVRWHLFRQLPHHRQRSPGRRIRSRNLWSQTGCRCLCEWKYFAANSRLQ